MIPTAVASPKTGSSADQWDTYVGLMIMVIGVPMIPNFSNVLQGRDPQFHKLWCIGLDNIFHEVHMTAQLEVGAGIMGGFMTNYLA